ncbi:MAG: NUDIX domain-containing protein [Alphaproteobacteria bacterium]|nr:NUDIX domain-containing protein [Alphaproteobacteria bacterium]
MTELRVARKFVEEVPEGDDRLRSVCARCGFVDYENPKIVVGSVASLEGRILLCRRAIEPRRGFWTLPAGYLEVNESVEDGARREAWEEARARLAIERVLAIYSVPRISQVQIMFRATLEDPAIGPGPESIEVDMFDWADIPWPEIAFPTVGWALRQWRESCGRDDFPPFSNPTDGV